MNDEKLNDSEKLLNLNKQQFIRDLEERLRTVLGPAATADFRLTDGTQLVYKNSRLAETKPK